MMGKRLAFVLFCALVQTAPAFAQSKPAIAVYPTIVGPGASTLANSNFDLQSISRKIEEALRATRRFSVFERSAEVLHESVLKEQDLAQSGLAEGDAAEFGKLRNVAFVVQPFVTEFRFGSAFEEIDGLPGKYRRTDSGAIAVTLKVLDTTSGEIKYQVTSKSEFRAKPVVVNKKSGAPSSNRWSKMIDEVALSGASSVVNSTFPILVVKFNKGKIFLNRGEGGELTVGDSMQIFSAGEALVDPLTGENLGAEELPIGTIRIVRVLPKFSVAEAVGDLEIQPEPGDIVRKVSLD